MILNPGEASPQSVMRELTTPREYFSKLPPRLLEYVSTHWNCKLCSFDPVQAGAISDRHLSDMQRQRRCLVFKFHFWKPEVRPTPSPPPCWEQSYSSGMGTINVTLTPPSVLWNSCAFYFPLFFNSQKSGTFTKRFFNCLG